MIPEAKWMYPGIIISPSGSKWDHSGIKISYSGSKVEYFSILQQGTECIPEAKWIASGSRIHLLEKYSVEAEYF